MTVRELLKDIERGKKEYADFMDWEVGIEVLENTKGLEKDVIFKKENDYNWNICKTHGFCYYFGKQKTFAINVHY
jgi:hypothetical protein